MEVTRALAQAMTAPALGGVLVGLGATVVGPATALVAGGVLCVIGVVLVGLCFGDLWRHRVTVSAGHVSTATVEV